MAHITADLIQETTTTTGTGAVTLAGATTGKRAFSAVMVNADTAFVVIDDEAGNYEGGLVTWNTGGTLTRTAGNVLFGTSGAGVLVNFGAGSKKVTLAPLSAKIGQFNEGNAMGFPLVTTDPAAPDATHLHVFAKALAGGRSMLKWIGDSGTDQWIQPSIFNNKLAIWTPPGNATTVPGVFGFAAPTAVGTATARNVASTNLLTRARRLGYVSAATAGSLAGHYGAVAQWTLGVPQTAPVPNWGGFFSCYRFGRSDATNQTGARVFVGFSSSVAAPTNVEPSTLTNCIGVGKNAADTTWQIHYGGSAAQTKINTGINCNTNTQLLELYVYAPANLNNTVFVRVVDVSAGVAFETTLTAATPGTQLPANTTFLAPRAWTCNNAAAVAVGIDVKSLYIETDN